MTILRFMSNLDMDEKDAILKARAKDLAQELQLVKIDKEKLEILEFQLNQERYGIETQFVLEVQILKNLTPLPNVPTFMVGIINVHGKIIPVIDFKKVFELSETKLNDLNKVIIVKVEDACFGILIDEISVITNISADNIQTKFTSTQGVRDNYLKGITDSQIVILDPFKIINDKRVMIDE